MKKILAALLLISVPIVVSIVSKAEPRKCQKLLTTKASRNNTANPLLEPSPLPLRALPFDKYQMEHFIPAIEEAVKRVQSRIKAIVKQADSPTFENTAFPLQYANKDLSLIGRVLGIYSNTMTSPKVREAYAYYQKRAVELSSTIFTNRQLYRRLKEIEKNQPLDPQQRRIIEDTLKTFEDEGVSLSGKKQKEFLALKQELTELSQKFEDNQTDYGSPENFLIVVNDPKEVSGLPDLTIQQAALLARENKKTGWAFGSTGSTYQAVMSFAESDQLRYQLWLKSALEGNDEGPYNNHQILKRIVAIEQKMSRILGYKTFSHKVLQDRMAKSPEKVIEFLNQMTKYVLPQAQREMEEIAAFKKEQTGNDELLKPWQTTFWARKLKEARYNFNTEQLKPYFEIDRTINGAFSIAKKLYNLDFVLRTDLPVYEPSVKVFEVRRGPETIGLIYADLFSRPGAKRGGAWMSSVHGQDRNPTGERIPPVVTLNMNIHQNLEGTTLMTVDEVSTLFHEFGHALHGLLSNVKYISHASPDVFWDFVELPSQFMENYVFQRESLDLFARHHITGELIPDELFAAFIKSRNFSSGIAFLSQLQLSYLDMAWYGEKGLTEIDSIYDFEQQEIGHLRLLPPTEERAPKSPHFGHIFGGGYASGYYSYKWAEVLDADAFAAFKESGDIFNPQLAARFEYLLSAGGSEDPALLYRQFRGREPSVDALLEREGIEARPRAN